ncbi:hypothetical protein HaLaN_13802, partial [Haematococcus lacustris]
MMILEGSCPWTLLRVLAQAERPRDEQQNDLEMSSRREVVPVWFSSLSPVALLAHKKQGLQELPVGEIALPSAASQALLGSSWGAVQGYQEMASFSFSFRPLAMKGLSRQHQLPAT